jgi:hypothetical protein
MIRNLPDVDAVQLGRPRCPARYQLASIVGSVTPEACKETQAPVSDAVRATRVGGCY